MGACTSSIANPNYRFIVEPMLRKDEGDASALLNAYPNFDACEVPVDEEDLYLHVACIKAHVHAVRGLLACGASLLHVGIWGTTALTATCSGKGEESVTFVAWLLSEHADARTTLNLVDRHGFAPFHSAVQNSTNALVRVLLAHGVDPMLASAKYTPAQLVRYSDRPTLTKLLIGVKFIHACMEWAGEWRPRIHFRYPSRYRTAMRTLVMLAKART
jgi:hypothetical protein